MSEWTLLALGLAGIVALITMPIFLLQRRDSRERHADLRAVQLQNARLILENRREIRRSHEDTKAFLKSMGIRLDQVFERVDNR